MEKIFAIAAVFVFLIFAGCVSGPQSTPSAKPPEVPAVTGQQVEPPRALGTECQGRLNQIGCLERLSLETGDIEVCKLIPDLPGLEINKDTCIKDRLMESETTDASKCQQLGKAFSDLCYNYAAVMTGNAQTCASIPSGSAKDWCIANVALQTNNPRNCDGISDSEIKGYCTAIFSSEPENCRSLGLYDWEKADCLAKIAFRTGNASLCPDNECRARLNRDAALCDQSDDFLRAYCIGYVALISGKISDCERIVWDNDMKYKCYALASKNKEYCEKISSAKYSIKSDCRTDTNLAIAGGRPPENFNGPGGY